MTIQALSEKIKKIVYSTIPVKKECSSMKDVCAAYELILQRPIDTHGRLYWQNQIKNGNFSKPFLVDALVHSPEYQMLKKTPFHEMVHLARVEWTKHLPKGSSILDIGGSSPNIDQGALIELGYPHRPKQLFIVDLPPEEQYWGKPKFPQDRDYTFSWGILKYFHGRAENIGSLKGLQNLKFDIIYMGQTIEHIMPDFLPDILDWISDHLSENGKFIFDTPNRLITSIQSDSFIDPDHKIEYTPDQLESILRKHNFSISDSWGLLPMPMTFQLKKFSPQEVYDHTLLSEDLKVCYLFAFSCTRN